VPSQSSPAALSATNAIAVLQREESVRFFLVTLMFVAEQHKSKATVRHRPSLRNVEGDGGVVAIAIKSGSKHATCDDESNAMPF